MPFSNSSALQRQNARTTYLVNVEFKPESDLAYSLGQYIRHS